MTYPWYSQSNLLGGLREHYQLEVINDEVKKHPSYQDCSCCLSQTLRDNMPNNPLEHITREEFAELFNRTKLITAKDLQENFNESIAKIAHKREKALKFIARFQTVVHAMEDATRDYEKNANAIERKKIAEASKRYDHIKKVQQKADAEKTGNELLDKLIAKLGSLEAAEAFLKDLKG